MFHNSFRPGARILAFSLASSLLASVAFAAPVGVGSFTVPEPVGTSPLPVVDNYRAQAGVNAQGEEINKYDRTLNPIIAILSGFDDIWRLGDDAWANGGANGDGAQDYSRVKIVNPAVWAANMAYVLKVTGSARTEQAALNAYLDDRRSQGYSIIDGMGPLAEVYKQQAGAITTLEHELGQFAVNEPLAEKEEDEGTEAGTGEPALQDFAALMTAMRGPEGTTSPAKYFYGSPRPWRMTDSGDVVQTGEVPLGDNTVEVYESHVAVIPALLSARETRGRQKDGGFPSGHTNAGYLAAYAYAYALPERFAELLTRASELGENRVVSGMHSPLDVIGGRIMATATAAAYLGDPQLAAVKVAAYENMQAVMQQSIGAGESLVDAAQAPSEDDRWADDDNNRSIYRARMTYGLPQDMAAAGQEMVVPKGAEVLLETRLPYLDAAQRRIVLYTTGIDSGYPLLDASNGWGRLDLVAAAAGYGTCPGDVVVEMDASKGGFWAQDSWAHDISGPGMLTKSGDGALTLAGDNSYGGGTIVKAGTLVAVAPTALGTGDVLVEDGTLEIGTAGLVLAGALDIAGGTLIADVSAGDVMITAKTVTGAFDAVTNTAGDALQADYADGVITISHTN